MIGIVVALVVLGFLILIHELGHFLVARACGVRVEAFSIGFGKPLIKWQRGNTEYRIAMFPLGGYVKMAGETPSDEKTGAPDEFISQPAYKKILIIVAGPAMNILFGILLIYIMFVSGIQVPSFYSAKPVIYRVQPGSPAALAGLKAGDMIESLNGVRVQTWSDVYSFLSRHGAGELRMRIIRNYASGGKTDDAGEQYESEKQNESLAARNGQTAIDQQTPITAQNNQTAIHNQTTTAAGNNQSATNNQTTTTAENNQSAIDNQIATTAGNNQSAIDKSQSGKNNQSAMQRQSRNNQSATKQQLEKSSQYAAKNKQNEEELILNVKADQELGILPYIPPKIGAVVSLYPAEKAGLRAGDVILEIDGQRMDSWYDVSDYLKARPGKTVNLKYRRGDKVANVTLKVEKVRLNDEEVGMIGIQPVQKIEKFGVLKSVKYTFSSAVDMSLAVFYTLKQLVSGKMSANLVSGPLGIIYMTRTQVQRGIHAFIKFVALLTINLGVINLLPIPVVDGGELLTYSVEGILRRRIDEKFRMVLQQLGLAVIILLFVFALYSDIIKIFSFH